MILLLLAQIEITAELSKEYLNSTLSIGDPFEVVVTAQYPPDTRISEPFVDSLDDFLIVDQKSRSIEEKGRISTRYNIRMVPFETGELQIPAFTFLVQSGEAVDTIASNEVPLRGVSVMPDEMQDINDIKKAVEFPNFMPLIVAVLRAASFTICQLSLRRIAAQIIAPAAPTAAASVGEAIPAKMEPRMLRMRRMGRISPRLKTIFFLKETLSSLGSAGPSFGLSQHLIPI